MLTSLISPVSRLMLAIMVLSLRLPLNSCPSVWASTPNRAMFIYPCMVPPSSFISCTCEGMASFSGSMTVTLGPSLVLFITRYSTATITRMMIISKTKRIILLLCLAARCLALIFPPVAIIPSPYQYAFLLMNPVKKVIKIIFMSNHIVQFSM